MLNQISTPGACLSHLMSRVEGTGSFCADDEDAYGTPPDTDFRCQSASSFGLCAVIFWFSFLFLTVDNKRGIKKSQQWKWEMNRCDCVVNTHTHRKSRPPFLWLSSLTAGLCGPWNTGFFVNTCHRVPPISHSLASISLYDEFAPQLEAKTTYENGELQ